jgi:hypothetical protein
MKDEMRDVSFSTGEVTKRKTRQKRAIKLLAPVLL